MVVSMHIRDWPTHERPREKLLARGAGVLTDAELLAIFLGSGLRGARCGRHRTRAADRACPLRNLLERTPEQLVRLPGLGPARACVLAAALELGQRLLCAELERGAAMRDPQAAGRYFRPAFAWSSAGVFAALFLDVRHRALAFEELFQGTIDGAEVHPREVVRRALAHNAAAVIVGHNHPSGNPEPSAADRAVTARLKQALALVDLRLLDHLVIGDGPPTSMAARGWV
jgi:DNA repair protein RadC